MLILGIDPGLAHTGWGVIDSQQATNRACAYGHITTDSSDTITQRLTEIHSGICRVIEQYQPDQCAIEDVFFGVNAATSVALGQARGAAILAVGISGLELGEYSPTEIKKAIVGNGRADKQQIAYMVRALLNLDHDPKPDHCSDALAIALTHAALIRLSQHPSIQGAS